MNADMAYLLGMYYGNGRVNRTGTDTTIYVEIPHKNALTDTGQDVLIYVAASINDMKTRLQPLIGTILNDTQQDRKSVISFTKNSEDYLIREFMEYVNHTTTATHIRINERIYDFPRDYRLEFLRGFADTTGYIRRSNYYFERYNHRVYIEIPKNWGLVIDICNLLASIEIPVQTIDWAHPNIRDGNLAKYNDGYENFWKKEHQIKIWATQFIPIGFTVRHKNQALSNYSQELIDNSTERDLRNMSKFYWEKPIRRRERENHPMVDDEFIPEEIRGIQYSSAWDIARDLGYGEPL